jgi:tellurite resistance protein
MADGARETIMTAEPRPKRFPPPEFPPRRSALFAKTPPAIFPPILGLLGLAIAVRLAFQKLGWNPGAAELLAGAAVALWAFATVAYLGKLARRPGVVVEDLRVLPGRSGLAAMTMGGMATATLISPYAGALALGLIFLALVGHAALAVLLIRLLLSLEPPQRQVNPTWHLSFVGFIVAAPAAVAIGWTALAEVVFWATLPVALMIWALSLVQFVRAVPPPPLRPLLAIQVAPASLLAIVAALLGKTVLATGFLAVGIALALLLVVAGRWVTGAGVTPMWGAFTFPLAALGTAMLTVGGFAGVAGLVVVLIGLGAIPAILWWVLKRWPGGKLAAITNAAEA